jgi:cystathionine beta-synthase
VHVSQRVAQEIGGFWANQWDNTANRDAHYRSTGPEIWEQTEGRLTHLVVSVGTGGTVSGVARVLKERNPAVVVVGADPEGSVLSGDQVRPYLQEGIGEDFFPGTFDPSVIDRWVRVSDRDAFSMARRITREEGILAGESCGTAMVAARAVVRDLMAEGRRDGVVVVLFPDGGRNYLSKLYNDEWMRVNGLMDTPGSVARVAELLAAGHHGDDVPDLVVARTTDRVGAAIDLLQEFGISQMPVSQDPDGAALESLVGSISEKGLLDRAFRDPAVVDRTVGEVMDRPLPVVDDRSSLDDAFALLSEASALIATRGSRPVGVVTKLDLLEFLSHRADGHG